MWTQGFRLSFTPLPGCFSPFLHSTLLYRSLSSVQPCGVVPAPSARVPRVPAYSGSRLPAAGFGYGALTLSGWLSQSHSPAPGAALCGPNPGAQRAPVWAPPISLAATLGIDVSFSSSGYLDVSVRRVPLHALCVGAWIHGGFPHVGFPIQTPADHRACAPPRSFSQLVASFVGS